MNTQPATTPVDSFLWTQRAIWFLLGLGLLRIVYLALDPFDLVHDEAYYWDWSRQLDYGYFSKPPMIAWIIGLSTRLLGDHEFAVRLPAVLLGTGSLAFLFLLARRMYDAQVAFWAMLLAALTPGNVAMSLMMTIDAPFLFFWSVAMYCFWRLLERGEDRWKWLLATMLFVGLGLLTKQTMAGILVFGGIFVLLSKEDRFEALRPGLYVCALGALLFLAPVVYWNYQHDWVTVAHTSEHFHGESVSWLRHIAVSLEFVGGLFGVLSPITMFLVAAVGLVGLASFFQLGRRERYLLCMSMLPLMLVLGLSLKQRLELNWPAPFFSAGIVLATAWALGHVPMPKFWLKPAAWRLKYAAIVGGVCVACTYAMPFLLSPLGLNASPVDAIVRMRGWEDLGSEVGLRMQERHVRSREMIVTAGRAIASELAFYMPQHPQVYLWEDNDYPLSQYDVWGGPQDADGRDLLVVTRQGEELPHPLRMAFQSIEPVEQVEIEVGPGRSHALTIYQGRGFRGWSVAKSIQASEKTLRR
ncbi:phospholipid carrier-dependent glycosyltransferase [bacterium]|nr:phospholipid carrier-dependent glycosyltransferase [bacterium]